MQRSLAEQGPSADEAIASAFRAARLDARALPGFPGIVPATLAEAYRVQDAAIAGFPDQVAGWKIAGIAPEWRDRLGAARLAGPVMRRQVRFASNGTEMPFPVFPDGFAAVEAEFILCLGQDIPDDLTASEDGLLPYVGALHAGVETAGSPFAGINDLGPCSVISDLGNNSGIIVGPAISGWENRDWARLTARCSINGELAGEGSAARVMDGPLAAFGFLVTHLRARGYALKAGDYISTGMTTGIHLVAPGDLAEFEFAGGIRFSARAVSARPV
ncbi:hypothetical protein [Rhabdaerophilum sp. SD176]|uniref:2-keto-4-pentenoate hydratase n=1 Tax=Rhabdaerophilum sp. SD176 TaxID=2983548 RepID=UPI0024DF8CD7|nr:hypothetical protein [Rhabdaerophilum sp. SD176]